MRCASYRFAYSRSYSPAVVALTSSARSVELSWSDLRCARRSVLGGACRSDARCVAKLRPLLPVRGHPVGAEKLQRKRERSCTLPDPDGTAAREICLVIFLLLAM
ncbi:hypothetical protein U1Q18_009252 [Sarracenia purpurea var. burkii]